MDVSSQHQSSMALDLSKRYSVNPLTCGSTEAMDLDKKTEWYRRHQPNCSREVNPPYRSSSSYSSVSPQVVDGIRRDACLIPLHPEIDSSVHCRDMEHSAETIGSYMNSTLSSGLQGLYPEEVHSKLWHSGFYGPNQPETEILESSGEEDSESGSDVIFLVSTNKDSLLCSSVSRESVSPILEPLSPAAMSLDEGRSCYLLPQALTSPSPGSTSSDDSSDSSVDIPVRHTRPVVLLSDLCAVYSNHAESPLDISSDDSDVVEVCVTHERKKACNYTDYVSSRNSLAGESRVGNDSPKPRELRRSARIRKSASVTQEFSRSVPQYNLRNQNKNTRVFYDSGDIMELTQNISSSEKEPSEQPSATRGIFLNSEDSDKDTQSVSVHSSKTIQNEPPHVQQTSRQALPQKSMKRKQKQFRSKQNTHKRRAREQLQTVSAGGKTKAKNTSVRRRKRRKNTQTGPSTLSFPREPEIQFKYIKLKEEKKKKKQDCFHPFVHVEHSVCTVVNYQEDELSVRHNRKQQHSDTSCLPGFIPKTSCLQIGRLSSESKCQPTQVCCLCGQSANAVGLGDLHGPYYPTGPDLDFQSQQHKCLGMSPDALGKSRKEEERSNGLSSSNGVHAADVFCDYDSSTVRSLKQSPMLDSHSGTKVPPYAEDCWIHEDCGVWAAGVFLVKGRLYGLQEAARLARETLCCTCRETGAIMGCFQKGCCRNYHYRCAILSGCVLNEDNFSMRCVKHKQNNPRR